MRRRSNLTQIASPADGGPMPYDRNNVFARILRGELPCAKVYEDEHVLAFREFEPPGPNPGVPNPKGENVQGDYFSEKASGPEPPAFLRAIRKNAKAEG